MLLIGKIFNQIIYMILPITTVFTLNSLSINRFPVRAVEQFEGYKQASMLGKALGPKRLPVEVLWGSSE